MAAYQMPLPQGWEAKYDERTSRYFFIDHINKVTSWEDPRIALQQQQHAQYQQQLHPQPHQHHATAAAAAHSPARSPRSGQGRSPKPSPRRNQEDIPMQHFAVSTRNSSAAGGGKPKCAECGQKDVDEAGGKCWRCEVESKYGISTTAADETSMNGEEEEGADDSGLTPTQLRFGVNADKYQMMKTEFPAADDELLQALMIRCNNNPDKVFQKLVSMGFKRAPPGARPSTSVTSPTPSTTSTTATNITTAGSHPKTLSPPASAATAHSSAQHHHQQQQQQQQQKQQQPKQPAPSPAKKMQLRDRLHAQYPDLAIAVIDMALDSCDFNEDKANHLLKTLSHPAPTRGPGSAETRPGTASTALSPASASTNRSGGTSSPTPAAAADAAAKRARSSSPRPAAASGAAAGRPTSGVITTSKSEKRAEGRSKAGVGAAPATTTATAHTTASKKPSAAPATAKSGAVATSGKRSKDHDKSGSRGVVAKVSTKHAAKTSDGVSAHHHAGPVYHSALRCKPNGPNPDLAKGPDDKLLLKEYIQWCGPNKENRKGPQVITGASVGLAKGPDHSLVKGPQAKNRKGPVEAKDNYLE